METTKMKKHESTSAFRKAPQAPRRFKSPYILFSISKMQEYKKAFKNAKVTSFSSRISAEWKSLSVLEREKWNRLADQDKRRYNAEKRLYTGPWVVPSDSVRKKRPKDAPKRPPSAFLNYCQKRRAELKKQNPTVCNTDISKLLGEEWKKAPAQVRQPHIDKEAKEREEYHKMVAAWHEHRRKAGTSLTMDSPSTDTSNEIELSACVPPVSSTPIGSVSFLNKVSPKKECVGSSMHLQQSLLGLQVPASSFNWNEEPNFGFSYVDESHIPTILPPAVIHSLPYHQAQADCNEQYSLPNSASSEIKPSSFPGIFQGDTTFDPPLW